MESRDPANRSALRFRIPFHERVTLRAEQADSSGPQSGGYLVIDQIGVWENANSFRIGSPVVL